jgi:glycosyltransferase involved in cell wall biosynthesis
VSGEPLRIAVLGAAPGRGESGGAPGVSTELLHGIAALGHSIDCYLPGEPRPLPARLVDAENLNFIWGSSRWRWNRWYSRGKLAAFVSGLLARALASVRLRGEITARHRAEPYDVLLQIGNIESLAVPVQVTRTVPLAMRPDTHMAGALKGLIAERRLFIRCQPASVYVLVLFITAVRTLVQRLRIHRATLLVCATRVFRDHLVHDYRFREDATVVIHNPVRLERFDDVSREVAEPPTVLVLSRISVRKGIEDTVALAHTLLERDIRVRIRIVGGRSLFSDYTPLLDDLPPENSEYVGRVPPAEVPAELARSDLLLQPSKYDAFGLTAAEALAAGVPVIATTEVGAIEQVDREVATAVKPGDVEAMASAIADMLGRLQRRPSEMSELARAEAKRLFAPDVVCRQLGAALEGLAERSRNERPLAR